MGVVKQTTRILVPLVVLVMTSCELVYGIKESGIGGAGGASQASTTTAVSSASSSSQTSSSVGSSSTSAGSMTASSSAGTSSSASSSSTAASSSSSGSTSSSGAPVSFCAPYDATNSVICDDFDDGALSPAWSSDSSGNVTSTFVTGSNAFGSAGYSFQISAAANTSTNGTPVYKRLHETLKPFTAPFSGQLHAEFEVNICPGAATDGTAALDFVTIDCVPATGNTWGLVRWSLHDKGDVFGIYPKADAGTDFDGGATGGTWAMVDIYVTLGNPGSVQFKLNNNELVNTSPTNFTCSGGYTQFTIGLADYPITNACTVSIDNVLVTLTP